MIPLPPELIDEILELLHDLAGHERMTREDHSPSPAVLRVSQLLKEKRV